VALKKKQGSQAKQRTELGVFGLILALVIMGAIGRFLSDATGYAYGWFGMFWWTTAVFVPFLLGLLYFALFVLPIPGVEGWAEGMRLIWRNYISPPRRPEPAKPPARKKGETAVDPHLADLPPSFASLRCGITRSHQALALVKGARFSRSGGPGFVTLYKGEGVAQVVDLRRQTRSETVKANTRDGIPVECPLFVSFRIWQQEPEQASNTLAYPYDPEAIFQVNYTSSVDPGDNLRRWSNQIAPQAAALLVLEIAQHSLDELYQVDANGLGPIQDIRQRIKRNLESNESLAGVEILGVGTGKLSLPDPVLEQRIKQWQAKWLREIQTRRATGDAEIERRMKQARARAQIEIIDNITQNIIEARRADGVNLTDVITLRMIEALEEAASSASVKALLPPPMLSGVIDSSRTMRVWVEGQEEKTA
jgi:regulator of protease activity HflC (stomatin/prohibitin superfamily)